MFQFPGFAPQNLCIQFWVTPKGWVSPFRHRRIKAYCQLPVAFRRLSRLSSPVIAKASTTCTYSHDPITLSPQPCGRSVIYVSQFKSSLQPDFATLSLTSILSHGERRQTSACANLTLYDPVSQRFVYNL
jgi:hypothetical protein